MKARVPASLSRRRALAPLAGLALATLALSRAAAQEKVPGTYGMTDEQKTRLARAVRYLRLAKAQVDLAYPASVVRRPSRFISALDAALTEGQFAAAGRWR